MLIDFAAEFVAALRSPEGRAALAEAIRPVIADEVRKVLEGRESDRWLAAHEAAALVGRSPAAFRMLVSRNAALAACANGTGRSRRWRRTDLERWLAAKGSDARRKLRAVEATDHRRRNDAVTP